MRPLLSICIPTFRRAEIVYKTVQNHLSIVGERIEVVVCDNHSPDHTLKLLAAITDSRFKLYTNDKNEGFPYNLSRVLKEATGHFVCMMSDEDILNKDALKQILIWIEDFIEHHMDVAVIIPNYYSNLHTITKENELINALYGRASYMSGLIINSDKLEDDDFIISSDNYYPHIQLILKAGVRGRIIYSSLRLYEQMCHDETSAAESIEIQKEDEAVYKETYVEPNSRLKQFKTESHMILELDINKKVKLKLFTRQYQSKCLQGTIIYELIIRNEKLFKSVASGHKVSTLDIDEEFNKVYIDGVRRYIGEEYLQSAIDESHAITDYICKVQSIRREFDRLTNEKGYPGVLVGSIPFIEKHIKLLLEYGFNISYFCTNDSSDVELGDRGLGIEELKRFNKVVLIADEDDSFYIEALNNIEIEDAYLFHMNDFRISL